MPQPGAAARAASRELEELLRARIAAAGGWIPFAQYVHAVLYEPGLGYYTGGSAKLGAEGDFITAPALGDFLARATVATIAPLLADLETPEILELGAGTGELASALLTQLDDARIDLARYRILEPSAELRQRQRRNLARFGSRVAWLDSLAGVSIEGLVLANEVADALPFERFRKIDAGVRLLGVALGEQRFVWALDPEGTDPSDDLGLDLALVAAWPVGYESEYRPLLRPWIASLADCLARGAVMIIDYGLPQREYYHPERTTGTLICHYRHRAHDDPFWYPGLQDITAWVDFSACARAAEASGLTLAHYTTQGGWLLAALAATPLGDHVLDIEAAARLKTLVLPGEMGESFKLLALTRGLEPLELPGRNLGSRL